MLDWKTISVAVGVAVLVFGILVGIVVLFIKPYRAAWVNTLEKTIDEHTETFWLGSTAAIAEAVGDETDRYSVFDSNFRLLYDNKIADEDLPTEPCPMTELMEALHWGYGWATDVGRDDSPAPLNATTYNFVAKSFKDAEGYVRIVRIGTIVE